MGKWHNADPTLNLDEKKRKWGREGFFLSEKSRQKERGKERREKLSLHSKIHDDRGLGFRRAKR